jgi:hypothetical protein
VLGDLNQFGRVRSSGSVTIVGVRHTARPRQRGWGSSPRETCGRPVLDLQGCVEIVVRISASSLWRGRWVTNAWGTSGDGDVDVSTSSSLASSDARLNVQDAQLYVDDTVCPCHCSSGQRVHILGGHGEEWNVWPPRRPPIGLFDAIVRSPAGHLKRRGHGGHADPSGFARQVPACRTARRYRERW